jgi:hypothetical protein
MRRFAIAKAAVMAAFLVSTSLAGQQKYHLELEATPSAAFPYLCKFGDVTLHVYAGGVKAEALWLDAISRNGSSDVTVMNPLGRLYTEVPVSQIAPILQKLAGTAGAIERGAIASFGSMTRGKVGNLDAARYRLSYGPAAYIDVWTISSIPENPQYRRLVSALLEGISPGTARVAPLIAGTPVMVELNFRRFPKVQILKLKKLTMAAGDEEDALTRGPIYLRATVLEKLFERAR